MVLPESKTFGFGISDSLNILELFLRKWAFSNLVTHLHFKKKIKNYLETTTGNYIFVLNITNNFVL